MLYVVIASIVIFVLILVLKALSLKKIIKLFDKGNVCVTGLRGTGKDMLFANVIARRKKPYISNMDYKCKKSVYIPLNFNNIDPLNNYKNFINDDLIAYDYPYPENCDIYLSDAGVYFPSQYCSELNRQYADMPVFQALSRHLGDCNFHVNVQNLNRVWDKIREQCDEYIRGNWCKVLPFKIVVQSFYVYDNYDSCLNRVEPYRHIKVPFSFNSVARAEYKARDEEAYRRFKEEHGSVRKYLVIYKNKSKYDTRLFKSLLSNGRKPQNDKKTP